MFAIASLCMHIRITNTHLARVSLLKYACVRRGILTEKYSCAKIQMSPMRRTATDTHTHLSRAFYRDN